MYRSYLGYLFRERRVALLFLFTVFLAVVLTLAFTCGDGDGAERGALFALNVSIVLCVGMTAVLPVLTFAFVHRRRSADVFLALPVGRGAQLAAGLTFCFAVPLACFLTAAVAALFFGASALLVLTAAAYAALVLAEMTVIHTCLFLLANNLFDGVVMMAAYSFLPVLVWVCAGLWTTVMVAGKNMGTAGDELLVILSPAAMSVKNFTGFVLPGDGFRPLYALLPAGYAILAALLLGRHFVHRPSERAEQVSDDPLAYPFVIHACAFLTLLAASAYAVRDSLRSVLIWYVLLFAAYISAMFVYRRSLRVEWRRIAVFAGMTALSLLIAWGGWRTRGFGTAEHYSLDGGDALVYGYDLDVRGDRLDEPCDSDDLYGTAAEAVRHVSFRLEIPQEERDRYEETVAILERLRGKEIAAYYEGKTNGHYMLLEVSKTEETSAVTPEYPGDDGRRYRYFDEWDYTALAGKEGVLTEEELLAIDRVTDVYVLFPYLIREDGEDSGFPLKEYLDLRERGLLPVPAAVE